jgi:hypothetical protein
MAPPPNEEEFVDAPAVTAAEDWPSMPAVVAVAPVKREVGAEGWSDTPEEEA